MAVSLCIFG